MTADSDEKIGGLLLAAGGSRRFGSPKQLAQFEGRSLLRRAAEAMAASCCDPIVVVLGAETERSRSEIADLPITICINENWRTGMSSSIRTGLIDLLAVEPRLDAVVITLCDQPSVGSDIIDRFAAKFRAGRANVIAAGYAEIKGVPALFASTMFDQLLNLEGDVGARELIRHRDNVQTIDMNEAAFDVDTPRDLDAIIKIESRS